MKKLATLMMIFSIGGAGCGGDEEAGVTVPVECAWTEACPTGWQKSGNTCLFQGETVTVGGTIEVFSLGNKVVGAVVKVQNFDQALPACAVSEAEGVFTVTGIPKGTDVTLSVLASDSYGGKPTYTFHSGGSTALDAPVSDLTVYVVNSKLASIFLPALKIKIEEGLPAGTGVLAGTAEDTAGNGVKGATATASTFQQGTSKLLYVAGLLPNEQATETDDSGRFVLAILPAGSTELSIQKNQATIGTSKAVVYDSAVSLANVTTK